MKPVIIESPFAGDREKNINYLFVCCRDSLSRGEAPFASHGFYTQFLDDHNLSHRKMGMEAGFVWGAFAELIAVYVDYGISKGMSEGIKRYRSLKIPIEYREIMP